MVFDGNMKNHRDVCYASSAGVANFYGLDGQVRKGCQNTPAFKSRYCSLHSPTVATRQADSDFPDRVTEEQVGFITGKRVTRTSTLYQVHIMYAPLRSEHVMFACMHSLQALYLCAGCKLL